MKKRLAKKIATRSNRYSYGRVEAAFKRLGIWNEAYFRSAAKPMLIRGRVYFSLPFIWSFPFEARVAAGKVDNQSEFFIGLADASTTLT